MPPEKLYVSIYEDDDEAFDIWTKEVGVDPSHMVRLGKEDNFWEHGSGPCGPCSEIYFDRGDEKGCGRPDCHVGCECDRFVEVWNLVFTQFESDGKGNYTPLEHPNIDTGMGLERLACVMQGVDNLFLVDTIQNIMKHISQITGVEYGRDEKSDVSLSVITDLIRSTTYMIVDGVLPSSADCSEEPQDTADFSATTSLSSIRFAIRLSRKISQLIPNSRKSRNSSQRLSRLRKKALPRQLIRALRCSTALWTTKM